jgi:TolA-binding protein
MSERHDPAHDAAQDVDVLARRLPRREPRPERSAAMRRALLDAAQQPHGSRIASRRQLRWAIGLGFAAAAAAGTLLVLRVAEPPGAPGIASTAPTVPSNPPPRGSLPTAPPAPAPAAPAATELPAEGVRTIAAAARPLQLTRGDATITVPPGARFEVDVRDDQVKRITVVSGWVVVAGAHTPTAVVLERQTWNLDAPPDAAPPASAPASPPASPPATTMAAPSTPPSTAPSTAPAPSRSPLQSPPLSPSSPRASHVAPPKPPRAPVAEAKQTAPPPAQPVPAPVSEAASAATAAERAFRDGLRALLAGDARRALEPLGRACAAPTTSQEDACYWAALAQLRSGDRPGARQAFQELLTRWPASTHAGEASVALGWLLLDAGDREAARARFAAAVYDRMPTVRAEAARGLAAVK